MSLSFLQQLNISLPSFLKDSFLVNSEGTLRIDSRDILPGDVYLALPLENKQLAKNYKEQALQRGALFILEIPEARQIWSQWSKYCFPKQPKICVAVTGTNGKTSVTDFVRQLWHHASLKAASIGTLGLKSEALQKDILSPKMNLTTPDAYVLHQYLQGLAEQGIDHVALEASSHGLEQYRLDQVSLKAAAFTNLSHEHLDYHETMESYFQSKVRLFQDCLPATGKAVLNYNDSYGLRLGALCAERGIEVLWFGYNQGDLKIDRMVPHVRGLELILSIFGQKVPLELPLIGLFQVENILAALGLVLSSGLNMSHALEGLNHLKGVPGRMEYVGQTAKGGAVYVDYAHKPLALENILKCARLHTTGKISLVFGCGGNRDTDKRPIMGKLAQDLADNVYVTDDNPREEDPASIRAEILRQCPKAYEVPARDQAILKALSKCERNDMCIIAGKGHETGQIIKNKVIPFDDRVVAQQFLNSMSLIL